MKVQYKDRTTILEEKLAPAGDYHFHVTKAEEQVSQYNNKKYINLTLKISAPGVNERTEFVKMYEDDSEKWLDFCETVGILDVYKTENITCSDCVQKSGSLKIIRLKANGEYKASNKVVFLPNTVAPKGTIDSIDADVPFWLKIIDQSNKTVDIRWFSGEKLKISTVFFTGFVDMSEIVKVCKIHGELKNNQVWINRRYNNKIYLRCMECSKKSSKENYKKNKEKICLKSIQWMKNNKEQNYEIRKKYYSHNRDKIIKRNKIYREKNKERITERERKRSKILRSELHEWYIKSSLKLYKLSEKFVPKALIDAKRNQLLLYRKIKELKNGKKN